MLLEGEQLDDKKIEFENKVVANIILPGGIGLKIKAG